MQQGWFQYRNEIWVRSQCVSTIIHTRMIIYNLSAPCMFSMLLVSTAHVRLPPSINSLCLYQNLYGTPTAWLRGTPEVIPEVICPLASLSVLPTLCLFLLVVYVLLAYISSLFRMSTSFVGHSVVPLILLHWPSLWSQSMVMYKDHAACWRFHFLPCDFSPFCTPLFATQSLTHIQTSILRLVL